MMKSKAHQNKFLRIIKMPIRALAKARDFYVKSMNNYADRVCYGTGGSAFADPLPRSFSTTSSRSSRDNDDDFRELVRAASTNTLGNRIGANSMAMPDTRTSTTTSAMLLHQQRKGNNMAGSIMKGVPRSASVGMGKIEEDKPSEFDDVNVGKHAGNKNGGAKHKNRFFPRSRSYAVGSTKRASTLFS